MSHLVTMKHNHNGSRRALMEGHWWIFSENWCFNFLKSFLAPRSGSIDQFNGYKKLLSYKIVNSSVVYVAIINTGVTRGPEWMRITDII